jgi:hypothetical protein
MSNAVTEALDKIADELEQAGKKEEALELDKVSDTIDKSAVEDVTGAEELIAADLTLIETAVGEVDAADREIEAAWEAIEAARKRKKKWVKGINLKKGRLTSYKRPGESMSAAAERALRSDDPSVRGMGSFYMASRKFKHGKGKHE